VIGARLTRREAIRLGAWSACALSVGSCRKTHAEQPSVTLYTSVDAAIARPVLKAFEELHSIRVLTVTDTEATKTAGLVQRLAAERDDPRADVWWSSEVLGTIALAQDGLLQPSAPKWLHEEFSGSWPGRLCDARGMWWGVAQRARVVAYSTALSHKTGAPWSLDQLISHEPAGRVALAQPQFGTTRSHFAALALLLGGVDALRDRIIALKRTGVRLYPGNSAVVRAVAEREADLGLTDTDDVWAAKANRWPVDLACAPADAPENDATILIPNTVALVGGKKPGARAQALLDFLTSAQAERLLASGESGNFPIRPDLGADLARSDPRLAPPPRTAVVDWSRVGELRADVDRVTGEVFPL
jgi:iron(III) transport system substrate-binding protein